MNRRVVALIVAGVLAVSAGFAMVLYLGRANQRAVAGQEATKVWVAMRLTRMSSSPGGTPGGITGLTKTPSSCRRLQKMKVFIVSLT